jgi:molecular chaperone GrpE
MPREEGRQEPVVVRDRRRIDPETGRRRAPASDQQEVTESMSGTLHDGLAEAVPESDAEADAAQPGSKSDAVESDTPEPGSAEPDIAEPDTAEAEAVEVPGEPSDLQLRVDELTADLQRVSAEYANYRKRVERDREAVIAAAKASVVTDLLTVLDDVERAENHGDLTGAFKAVADKLLGSLTGAGLEPFGAEGDDFDPSVHQAVQHDTSAEVSGPTVTAVLRRGYRFGERVLRPAMVAVTDHEAASPEPQTGEQDQEQEPEQGHKHEQAPDQKQEQQQEQQQES